MFYRYLTIEQRIGRIDRIGQKHTDIAVLNMCYLGSAEEIVYGRLLKRLQEANLVVGVQQISLLPVEPEEFRGLADRSLTEEEVTERAKERIVQQRRANASMELTTDEQYTIYSKMTAAMHCEKLPATLDDLWSALIGSRYLDDQGAKLESDDVWNLPACEELPRLCGTVRRDVLEGSPEFITWGNAKTDMILDKIASYSEKYGGQIHRISAETSVGNSLVGYLVMTKSGPQLITDYSSAKDVEIDLSRELSGDDIKQYEAVLNAAAAESSLLYERAKTSEAININYARLHINFIRSVALALLRHESDQGQDNFWAAIKDIENNGKSIPVSFSSAEFVGHENELLFPIHISPVLSSFILLPLPKKQPPVMADGCFFGRGRRT